MNIFGKRITIIDLDKESELYLVIFGIFDVVICCLGYRALPLGYPENEMSLRSELTPLTLGATGHLPRNFRTVASALGIEMIIREAIN